MAASRLLEALDKNFIGGIQEQDRERVFVFSPFPDDNLQIRQLLTASDIHTQGDVLLFSLSVHDQLRKFFN